MSSHALVMGGTRFMGIETVRELLERGHRVTVFNRGRQPVTWPGPVHEVHGDRNNAGSLRSLASLRPDAVLDFSAYTGEQTRSLLDELPGVSRWVHCSTGAVYRPGSPVPWSETTPDGPWPMFGGYAAAKLDCELALRRARPDQVTIALRLPYVLGPRNYADREEFLFNRLLDGAEILVPGSGQSRLQVVHVRQVASAFANALEVDLPPTWQAYNVADDHTVSLPGLVEACAAVAGVDARTLPAPTNVPAAGAFDAATSTFPFPDVDYLLDTTASQTTGISPAPLALEAMLTESLSALLADPERRQWRRTTGEEQALSPSSVHASTRERRGLEWNT